MSELSELSELEKEPGMKQQMMGVFKGKLGWMSVIGWIESIVFLVLMIMAIVKFLDAQDVKWRIFYATGFLVLSMVMVLIKVWFWMLMHRNAIRRDIKRLELRMQELRKSE